jgi:hypothetical protein
MADPQRDAAQFHAENPTVDLPPFVPSREHVEHYAAGIDDTTGKHRSGWPIENCAPPPENTNPPKGPAYAYVEGYASAMPGRKI